MESKDAAGAMRHTSMGFIRRHGAPPLETPKGGSSDPMAEPSGVGTRSALASSFSEPYLMPNATGAWPSASPSTSRSQVDLARSGSGRFYAGEIACFQRRPHPSPLCGRKAEVYWQSTGSSRSLLSLSGLHTLPTSKGEFWLGECSLPESDQNSRPAPFDPDAGRPQPLELESKTANVLDHIYPRMHMPQEMLSDDVGLVRETSGLSRHSVHQNSQRVLGSGTPGTAKSSRAKKDVAVPQQAQSSGGTKKKKLAATQLATFRQKIIDKFATMQNAFECFALQTDSYTKELNFKEFDRFLNKYFHGMSKEDREGIFDYLDMDKNGQVSMAEFHSAIEALYPVQTMEDLRRKLIALGYTSMRKVLYLMWDAYSDHEGRMKRLSFNEFKEALARVGVSEEDEAQHIFNLLRDHHDHDPKTAATISFDMLWAGMAAVSPHLLLEDLRDTLLKRYGSFEKAFECLENNSSVITNKVWLKVAVHTWKMTAYEASKTFRLIDANNSYKLSLSELTCTLRLSEPSLFLEEIRKKVRQRFRSIKEALHEDRPGTNHGWEASHSTRIATKGDGSGWAGLSRRASQSNDTSEARQLLERMDLEATQGKIVSWQKKTPEQLQTMLARVQLTDAEVKTLWELVDVNRDGKLSPMEFDRGIKFFAPSCRLEDLRLHCLSQSRRISDAFAKVSDETRKAVLEASAVKQLLDQLQLSAGVDVKSVCDLLDRITGSGGGLMVGELIAALMSAAPGAQVPLPPEERDAKAKRNVRHQLAPFLRSASELRNDVRLKPEQIELASELHDSAAGGTAAVVAAGSQSSSPTNGKGHSRTTPRQRPSSSRTKSPGVAKDSAAQRSLARGHHGRERESPSRRALRAPTPTKKSYLRISRYVRTLPPSDATPILERLHGYYSTAGDKMTDDQLLLVKNQSRLERFLEHRRHEAVLRRPLA